MKLTGLNNVWGVICVLLMSAAAVTAQTYKIVDTNQSVFYNNNEVISAPSDGQAFYGQDAQYNGNRPSYTDNGDGTVTDNVTGLMWQKSADLNGDGRINAEDKRTYEQALAGVSGFNLAGYADWRLPSIKEAYSLILFSGEDISGYSGTAGDGIEPFIDDDYFEFGYGDVEAGERLLEGQMASATKYVTTTRGEETMFGVNFVDGRIKGYGLETSFTGGPKVFYVMYVRSNTDYGKNSFEDNNDGTITDHATGLMWMQNDNGEGIFWQDALRYAENFVYAGHTDWRLPNAKELQSIVDYTRSPVTTTSAAIDSIFTCTQIINEAGETDYPYYWTGTTHASWNEDRIGASAVYLSFGRAMGYIGNEWTDVHGAGAQRSDPKTGDPGDYPTGFGPQGDAVRMYNYVRLVRDAGTSTHIDPDFEHNAFQPKQIQLSQNYPNPFNSTTVIGYQLPVSGMVCLSVFDISGQEIVTLVNGYKTAGSYKRIFDASHLPGGVYVCYLRVNDYRVFKKMTVVK